jgi:hypothetical protein
MSAIVAALAPAIPALAGTILGFLLASGREWWVRKRKIKSHWEAIRAEMALCEERVTALRAGDVMSPLYRFPLVAVQTAFPILLAEGNLNEHETLAVSRYFSLIEDVNRGLDYVASCVMQRDLQGAKNQYARVSLKINHLMLGEGEKRGLLESAKAVVDGRLLQWREFV